MLETTVVDSPPLTSHLAVSLGCTLFVALHMNPHCIQSFHRSVPCSNPRRSSAASNGGPIKRTRRSKQNVQPRDVPLAVPEEVSMRNLLLANINEQHTLATRLFETLSTSLSGSRRGSASRSIDPVDEVAEMYARLEALTEEQARLVELARRHQERWQRLQRKRKRRLALEDKVRRVLVGLEQGRRELSGIVDDGRSVLEGIEMAEKGQSSSLG